MISTLAQRQERREHHGGRQNRSRQEPGVNQDEYRRTQDPHAKPDGPLQGEPNGAAQHDEESVERGHGRQGRAGSVAR